MNIHQGQKIFKIWTKCANRGKQAARVEKVSTLMLASPKANGASPKEAEKVPLGAPNSGILRAHRAIRVKESQQIFGVSTALNRIERCEGVRGVTDTTTRVAHHQTSAYSPQNISTKANASIKSNGRNNDDSRHLS